MMMTFDPVDVVMCRVTTLSYIILLSPSTYTVVFMIFTIAEVRVLMVCFATPQGSPEPFHRRVISCPTSRRLR